MSLASGFVGTLTGTGTDAGGRGAVGGAAAPGPVTPVLGAGLKAAGEAESAGRGGGSRGEAWAGKPGAGAATTVDAQIQAMRTRRIMTVLCGTTFEH